MAVKSKAPNQSAIPYEILKSSEYQLITRIDAEFERARDVDHMNRERNFRNRRAYFAVDSGQWATDDLRKLNDAKRHASQFNISGPKIDILAGELLNEKYDHDFRPIEGVRDSLVQAVNDTWYADKELCRYNDQIGMVIKDGLLYSGDLKMKISRKFNSLGNIYFERVQPGYLLRDPYWISDNDADCEKCWEVYHLDAIKIKRDYGISGPIIDQAVEMLQNFGGQYEDADDSFNQRMQLQTIGHLYRVIEYHWMETFNTTRIVGQKLNSDRWITFPITEDKARLEQFMVQNKIDPETMMDADYDDRIHRFAIICPQISQTKVLREGMGKIQCKRLPYFQFTANREGGKNKGIMDDLIDVQETINKRESKLTDLIETATGGGKLMNRDLFKTPDERTEFMQRANDPSYVGWVDGDELTNEKAVHYLNTNMYPSTLINQLERMYDLGDRVSKVPASMSSRSESANESGILHSQKMAVARLGNVTLFDRVKSFRHDIGEAYFEQWPWAYKGARREFSTRDGKHKTVLNERVFNEKEAKWYIRNRPDQVPRCSVIITEKPSSPSIASAKQTKFGEFYNLAVQSKQTEYANFFFSEILKTEDFDDEATAELDVLRAMNKARNFKRLETEVANMDASGKQAAFAGAQAMFSLSQLMNAQQQQAQAQQQAPVSEIPEEEVAPIELPSQAPGGVQP